MRHRVNGKKLGRDTKHRVALFKNLARALVLHGTVTTTEVKGKQLKKLADKLVTQAKDGSLSARRNLHSYFGKRDVVNTLVERVAPVMQDRVSGFTTLARNGTRLGDNTNLVTIAWVNQPEKVGSLVNPTPAAKPVAKKTAAKKTASASKPAAEKSEKKTESKPVAKKAPAKTTKKAAAKKTTKKSK